MAPDSGNTCKSYLQLVFRISSLSNSILEELFFALETTRFLETGVGSWSLPIVMILIYAIKFFIARFCNDFWNPLSAKWSSHHHFFGLSPVFLVK